MRISTKSVNYDLMTMLADVAGFTGFILGYSLLSFVDFISDIVTKLVGKSSRVADDDDDDTIRDNIALEDNDVPDR